MVNAFNWILRLKSSAAIDAAARQATVMALKLSRGELPAALSSQRN